MSGLSPIIYSLDDADPREALFRQSIEDLDRKLDD